MKINSYGSSHETFVRACLQGEEKGWKNMFKVLLECNGRASGMSQGSGSGRYFPNWPPQAIIFTFTAQPKSHSRNRQLNQPIIWSFPVCYLNVLDYWPSTSWTAGGAAESGTDRWAVFSLAFLCSAGSSRLLSVLHEAEEVGLLPSLVSMIHV